MKKITSFFAVIALIFTLAVGYVYAEGGMSLTGTSTVRAGDTIVLTLKVNATDAHGVNGEFDYDSDLVSISSISTQLSGWESERNGNYFISYDDSSSLNKAITGNSTLLTAKFYVKSSVKEGTKITISVKNGEIDGESGTYSADYSVVIAEPLSDDATLKRLSVEEGTLSPEFSSSVTEYDIGEVPFSVSKLDISATPNHSGAEVDISGNSLSVGRNKVRIKVTAETGAVKEYTITVTRGQDPDYVPSSDASLSEITLSEGRLSPEFDGEKTKYIVYVPFETQSISIDGEAEDSRATGVTGVEDAALAEGENVLTVTCKAEDGTELVYTVTVVRMPEYNGTVSLPDDPSSDQPDTPSQTESAPEPDTSSDAVTSDSSEPVSSEPDVPAGVVDGENKSGGIGAGMLIILLILAMAAGFALCFVLIHAGVFTKKGRHEGPKYKGSINKFTFNDK